jgi:uncharacterized protein with FMN-binding domain
MPAGDDGGGTDPGADSGPGASGPADAQPSGGPGATPGPSASLSPGATMTTPAPGASTAKTTTAPANSQTFTGAAIAVKTATSPTAKSSLCGECHDYAISVTITVAGGRITKTSVAYSTSPGSSQSYANSANTKLSQSVLTAQTWTLGRVSGATYAGNAWELSAKNAMSKAGLPV